VRDAPEPAVQRPSGNDSPSGLSYAYYTGCVAKESTRELDAATRAVCDALGIELHEMLAAPCCGAGDVHEIAPRLNSAVNALTLAQAEREGRDVLTICNVCNLNLRQVNDELRGDAAALERANRALSAAGYSYRGEVEVTHLLWVLYRDFGVGRLRAAVRRPLRGLKVAPFYGCQVLRPSTLNPVDDPDNPGSLEEIIGALGAQPVSYAERTSCCGFPIVVAREDTALGMSGKILAGAKSAGADAIVTPCPLCHLSLDGYQDKAERVVGDELRLPILHLPQLVGLALGLPPRSLGLHKHVVPTGTLLSRLGLTLG